jgi:hypothetical protein
MRFYTEQAEAVKFALNGMNSMHQLPPDGVQPGIGDNLPATVDAANHRHVQTVMQQQLQQQQQSAPMPRGEIKVQGLISINRMEFFLRTNRLISRSTLFLTSLKP